jgi:P4 family phage/plasmid primase-like protien
MRRSRVRVRTADGGIVSVSQILTVQQATAAAGAALQDNQAPANSLPLVELYGPPCFQNRKGDVNGINQAFWAGLFSSESKLLHEATEGTFYLYDETSGLYAKITSDLILSRISDRMLTASREWNQPDLAKFRSEPVLRGIIAHLKGLCELSGVFVGERKFIHLANGLISKSDPHLALRKFSPDIFSRNASPVCYKKDEQCPVFTNELLAPLDQEDKELLQKLFGQMLLGTNLCQRILILDGLSGAGKSQLALVLANIVGNNNCTELRTRLLEERFELSRLLDKTLLLGVDVAPNFLSTPAARVLKGLVGGDLMTAERKGSNSSFQFRGIFNCLITSNSRLRVRLYGDEGAWKRRLVIIRYETAPTGKKIPDFHKVLLSQEGPGILNWGLEGLQKLVSDIDRSGDLQLSKKHQNLITVLLAESDSLRLFIKSEIEKTSNANDLTTDEITKHYGDYCLSKGWDMTPASIVQKMLPDLMIEFFAVLKSHDIQRKGKNARGFYGVRFRDQEDEL